MIVILGLLLGIILGLSFNVRIPDAYSIYVAVAILACLDSVIGALKAYLSNSFDQIIFLSGFFGNGFIAVILTYFGDQLSIPMYLAAVIVFGSRIFNNVAVIRRLLIGKIQKGKSNEDEG